MNLKKVKQKIMEASRLKRVKRGWTQAELARRAGIPLQSVSNFEQKGRVSLERFLKISKALGIEYQFSELEIDADISIDDLRKQSVARRSRK